MRIAIGCDHGGFHLKAAVRDQLQRLGVEVLDCGAEVLEADDDYPDYTARVGRAVQSMEAERGIMICGSGVGASIAANKLRGVRAALCHDTYSARQGVEDDDLNVLCLGGRVIGTALMAEIVTAFVAANFSGAPRHQRRLAKIAAWEQAAP